MLISVATAKKMSMSENPHAYIRIEYCSGESAARLKTPANRAKNSA